MLLGLKAIQIVWLPAANVRLLLFLFNPRRGICFHFSSFFLFLCVPSKLQCTFSIGSCLPMAVCVRVRVFVCVAKLPLAAFGRCCIGCSFGLLPALSTPCICLIFIRYTAHLYGCLLWALRGSNYTLPPPLLPLPPANRLCCCSIYVKRGNVNCSRCWHQVLRARQAMQACWLVGVALGIQIAGRDCATNWKAAAAPAAAATNGSNNNRRSASVSWSALGKCSFF